MMASQIWDITISDGVLRRVVATSLLVLRSVSVKGRRAAFEVGIRCICEAQVDLLYPLQPAGSLGETYRAFISALGAFGIFHGASD